MGFIAVLQTDRHAAARLQGALLQHYQVMLFPDWDAFVQELGDEQFAACVVDIYARHRPVAVAEVGDFQRSTGIPVIVYSDFRGHELDLFLLGQADVGGVIASPADSPLQMRRTIERATACTIASQVSLKLRTGLHPFGLRALRWAVEHAAECPTTEDLAAALSVSVEALPQIFRSKGLPTPRRLLLWGRVFYATHMLELGNTTVEKIALRLGYATGSGLSRAVRSTVGESAGQVRQMGGAGLVARRCANEAWERRVG